MDLPLISVCMITFNHERFISQAIESILEQTYTNFELVIVNDGSTDLTEQQILKFGDSRIKYFHQSNQGPSAASNLAIHKAQGEYIALMSGDDTSMPSRLEEQLACVTKSLEPIVCFSHVKCINDQGSEITHRFTDIFNIKNPTRAEILRRFVLESNFLNAVSAFFPKKILHKTEPFDPRLLQLQDFDLWFRLINKYDFKIIQKPLVAYRVRDDQGNLSQANEASNLRTINEQYFVLKKAFALTPKDLLKEAFLKEIVNKDFETSSEIECEKALLLLNLNTRLGNVSKMLGLQLLFDLLELEEHRKVLWTKYQIDQKRFWFFASQIKLNSSESFFSMLIRFLKRKFVRF